MSTYSGSDKKAKESKIHFDDLALMISVLQVRNCTNEILILVDWKQILKEVSREQKINGSKTHRNCAVYFTEFTLILNISHLFAIILAVCNYPPLLHSYCFQCVSYY